MTKKTFCVMILLILLAACQSAPAGVPEEEDIDGITDFGPLDIPAFTLTDQVGRPVTLADFQGKHVLLYFGFTHCPDFCPATMNDFKLIKQELGDAAENVEFLFISVDPARDTPDVLKKYTDRFDPSFIAATGNEADLDALVAAFGSAYTIEDHDHGESYSVGHPSSKFLLTPDGKLTTSYSFGVSYDQVAADLLAKLNT